MSVPDCASTPYSHAPTTTRLPVAGSHARSRSELRRRWSGWKWPGSAWSQSFVPAIFSTNLGSPASALSLK